MLPRCPKRPNLTSSCFTASVSSKLVAWGGGKSGMTFGLHKPGVPFPSKHARPVSHRPTLTHTRSHQAQEGIRLEARKKVTASVASF